MSVTCCPLSGSDDDAAEFFDQETRRAAKVHRCCECDEEIPIGNNYEYVKGLWDKRWSIYRTCLSCVEIRNHFACEGWVFGELWNDLSDNFFPDMKAGGPCMEGLSPAAKGRLFEKRLAWMEAR